VSGRSDNLSVGSILLASLCPVLFFDEISVEEARDSTSIVNSPVIALVAAVADKPESGVLI